MYKYTMNPLKQIRGIKSSWDQVVWDQICGINSSWDQMVFKIFQNIDKKIVNF